MPMASNGKAFIKSEHVITSQCSLMITLQTFSYICKEFLKNQTVQDRGRIARGIKMLYLETLRKRLE